MTHGELVEAAVRWLGRKKRCGITVFKPTIMACEQPDALGWTAGGNSHLIECKISRADFFRDQKKHFRRNPESGIGTFRYYLTPPKLVQISEVPPNWGLLELAGLRVCERLKPKWFNEKNEREEMRILLAWIRRGGDRLPATESELFRIAS